MRFWDTSAIVPLLVHEPATADVLDVLREDSGMLVWWGSGTECVSVLARAERDGLQAAEAYERLDTLSEAWHEVMATDPVRRTAARLLRTHVLRAADALQLAAAIVGAEGDPRTLAFVSLDERLRDAAAREGFKVVRF